MPEIGIVANPHSKLNKRYPDRQTILGHIVGEHGHLEITNTFEDLSAVARRFRDQGIKILAINGGDGTVSRTLTAFLREYGPTPLPLVALLRGGTMNVLACNLGLHGSPEQLLYQLVAACESGREIRYRDVPMLEVNGHLGFLFGNGFAATFLDEFYRNKTGHIGSLWLIAKLYASALSEGELFRRVVQSLDTHFDVPGQPSVMHRSLAVLCSTVEQMPMGPKIFGELKSHPAEFQTIAYTMPPRELIWNVPRAVLQKDKPGTRVSFCSKQLTLRVTGSDLYTLDGELHRAPDGVIEIKTSRSIRFAVFDQPHKRAIAT